MLGLLCIIGIPFVVVCILKVIYKLTYKEKDEQPSINLISDKADYEKYLKINDNLLRGEI